MSLLTSSYSGIILNQNAPATATFDWRTGFGGRTIYQTFYLPSSYQLGFEDAEKRCPDLSGFQIFVEIDGYAVAATLDYTLDIYLPGSGWKNLLSGSVIGAAALGAGWFDVVFEAPLAITPAMVEEQFRIGITTRSPDPTQALQEPVTINNDGTYVVNGVGVNTHLLEGVPYAMKVAGVPGFLLLHQGEVSYRVQQGIKGIHYTAPSPLVQPGQAYQSDATTPLVQGVKTSLNFRILALTADDGTDFLGNGYRSCVITHDGTDTDTTSSLWMSAPMPSKFAVISRYFDVRPTPVSPVVGIINEIPDPSFEYDASGGTIAYGWESLNHAVTVNLFQVQSTWADSGANALRFHATFTGLPAAFAGVILIDSISVNPSRVYSPRAAVNILSLPGGASLGLTITWLAADDTVISTTTGSLATSPGETTLAINGAAPPPNATSYKLSIGAASSNTGALDFYLDSVQSTRTPSVMKFFSGDSVNCEWLGQRGKSLSAEVVPPEPQDDVVVIDGVLVDPATPNLAFNVYYSEDDSGTASTMTERDWEQKLWTRVPKAFTVTQRQQYVFPEPIRAKYVKIEFTNLQAQAYDPGNFQQPVAYKKFPTWVAEFFVTALDTTSFVANLVNVENDALAFAYDYYLDDVHQEPAAPSPVPSNQIGVVADYFKQNGTAQGLVDAGTLRKINMTMQGFRDQLGTQSDRSTVFGQYIANLVEIPDTGTAIVENPQAELPDLVAVSTTQREAVIFEQSMPVMYFFVTCRHAYKELQATFQYNRAYFAGINDIAFMRHNYATIADESLYIESGSDTANADRNDFVVDADHNWFTY